MVAGFEDASGGTICIGEREVADVAPKYGDSAMAFQRHKEMDAFVDMKPGSCV